MTGNIRYGMQEEFPLRYNNEENDLLYSCLKLDLKKKIEPEEESQRMVV